VKLRITILLFLILYCIFPGCRYKDGPLISFRTADRRLQGEFQAEVFEINGQEEMQIWNDSICDSSLYIYLTDVDNRVVIMANNSSIIGSYQLSSHKEVLSIHFGSEYSQYPGYGPFHWTKTSDWQILKLSNKKLWIKTTFEGNDYYIQLIKTKDLPYDH
jgi:hypothetical protein